MPFGAVRTSLRTATTALSPLRTRIPPRAPRFASFATFPARMTSTTTTTTTTMSTQKLPGAALLKKPLKIACVQLASGADKAANLARARSQVLAAAQTGAELVVLPECFNSPYGCEFFAAYAERLLPSPPPAPAAEATAAGAGAGAGPSPSPSYHALSAMAREAGVFLVGGSIPEVDGPAEAPRYYNTSLTFGPDGALLATHRKVHLFDIDIPGGIRFQESEVLSAGDQVTVVDLAGLGKIGVAICYDVRFPELAMVAARQGAFALVYPGAFNTTTGPLHWQLLGRARAVDNQVYVALCSPARDPAAGYQAWGHSLVVDPMARVLAEADEGETIVTADLDAAVLEQTRRAIPLRDQRRFDVYADVSDKSAR